MVKLKYQLAGFGAGLIAAAVLLQLAGTASDSSKQLSAAAGELQLDETKVKQWADANGYRLSKKEDKLYSEAQVNELLKSGAKSAGATGSVSTAIPSAQASSPVPSPTPSEKPSPTPSPSAPVASGTALQTPVISSPASPAAPKSVKIPDGLNSTQVGDILLREGIVNDKTAFDRAVSDGQVTTKLRSGTYTFTPGENVAGIISKLIEIPAHQ